MESKGLPSLFALLLTLTIVLSIPLSAASASSPITGVATSCGELATCSFALTDGNGGTGTASTSASVCGYVGQSPCYFSGGSVSFELPGESQTTYASGVYSGEAVLDGYSQTAGTLYLTTGAFAALDANSGLVVTGTTSTIVGIKGHSGRGGGITFTLVNGTISITEGPLHDTTASVTCSPNPIAVHAQTACTVTVTDTTAGSPVTPTGSVAFGSSGSGAFSSATCALFGTGATATCLVGYTPAAGSEGAQTITANYSGDSIHLPSPTASFVITAEKRSSSAILSCAPPFRVNTPTTCKVTILDSSPGNPMTPSGVVKFSSNHPGKFSSASCTLKDSDIATCSVTFTPTRVASYTLKASYGGNPNFFGSKTSQTFTVA